jgi:hypothetical protein
MEQTKSGGEFWKLAAALRLRGLIERPHCEHAAL